MLITILLFLLILAILIFVHELGHFTVAKLFGIRVDEFALGFPPRLLAKKKGETTYTLNAIPFGGFVKIFGEDPEEAMLPGADKSRSFYYKPKWIQALVLLAGIAMNIIFAYLLISIGFMIGLPSPAGTSTFGEISNPQVVITSVLPNSPAEKAGLIGGDTIISASSGNTIPQTLSPDSVSNLINKSQTEVTLAFKRGSADVQTIHITPSKTIVPDRQAIGISMDILGTLRLSPLNALLQGAVTTVDLLKNIVLGLWDFFGQVFRFKSSFSEVSGPIGIAKVVGQARSFGFVYVLSLMALISLNLAVINLVPFPALDGGRLLFVLIESVTRKNIPPKIASWTNGIGFALLLTLMIVISVHDVWGIL